MRILILALSCLLPASPSQAGASPAEGPAQIADLVLVNGTIFTGDPAQPQANAVAIKGGWIVAIGSDEAISAHVHAGTHRIDLGGRRVVPGINDAHEHLGWEPPPGVQLKLPAPEVSGAELEAALAAQPQAGDEWINGTIAAQVFTDLSWNVARLDALQPSRPVVLGVMTGHGMILNSAAIRALQVNPAVPVPGGWYGVDTAGGFDGRLFEYAGWKVARQFPRSPDATHIDRLQRYGEAASKAGVTSVQSMSSLPVPQFVEFWQRSAAPQRVRAIRWPLISSDQPGIPDLDLPRHLPGTRIEVSGTKWILDGTFLEQASPMRQPYPDTGRNGRLNFGASEMRAMLEEIIARDDQILLHVAGDAATEAALDAMASIAPPQQWRERRVRFEHGDGLAADLIPRAAEFGIIVVQNPSHQMLPLQMPAAQLLRERQLSPFADLLKAGIPLAIGSDGPMDPWLNMMFATALPLRPDQSLTREQVLRAYTWGSAYAEFKEHEKGRLAPGYLADLAVLSQDVLDEAAVPTQALPATRSLLTIIAGEIAWRDPSL